MLRVLLAAAELELAPAEVAGHPAIRRHAESLGKRPGQVLLDQNLHGAAMGKLEDGKRRGRPDLVHLTLLTLLEGPMAKAGALEVAVHTRHDQLIRLRTDTRLPRGEARFQGLMAKVLAEGRSNDGEPLIWVEGSMPPADALRRFAKGPVVRLDERGAFLRPDDIASRADAGELTAVLGAFPSGDFPLSWRTAAPEAASIWPEPLNVWACAAEVAAAFRARWGPHAPAASQPPGSAPGAGGV